MRPNTRSEFEIAIICALSLEADAVEALFDETYDKFGKHYGKQFGDKNAYITGRIGQHNVVLCYLPGMGIASAASAAANLQVSYTRIQLALVVGICGGVPFPSSNPEIVLGDIIISDSVIQYDFGRQYPDGFHQKSGVKETLGRSNQEIRAFLAGLKGRKTRRELQELIYKHLQTLQAQSGTGWQHPGIIHDVLFEASCRHKHYQDPATKCICYDCKSSSDPVCDEALKRDCNSLGCVGNPVQRSRLRAESVQPCVHIGTIACANTVMKSGELRDKLAERESVIGFEMEGAGVWDNLPCIIIKGVCDYADSHKNKTWQDYAAATAASGAKAFLEYWPNVTEVFTHDNKRCLSELLLSDPRDDKQRIERTKGGLLYDSFSWVLENHEFQMWRQKCDNQLLWVKGDAGKGKTMLLIGIINELEMDAQSISASDKAIVSYFLCQATDSRLNNATAILRGLIYLLIIQQPSLILYLQRKYDHAGRKLFEDSGAFYSLSVVFKDMLHDPGLRSVYLVIDALDECEEGLPQLLDLITQTVAGNFDHIKWVVSSRNRHDIEQRLELDHSHTRVSLELNASHITHAVNIYVDYKVSQLIALRHDQLLKEKVRTQLCEKSGGTFLWVALVVQELQAQDVIAADMLDVLEEIPVGLTPLYDRMMKQIRELRRRNLPRCLLVLSSASLAYRPLQLHEMHTITGLWEEFPQLGDLQSIIHMCGSFLTVRENYVYFIHQSAKDYLIMNASATIFPSGPQQVHHNIYLHSMKALSKMLRQNIYNLGDPGPITGNVVPDPDPLAPIRYSCLFWLDHLCEVDSQTLEYSQELTDNGTISAFFMNDFLHWLESLSLIHKVSEGVLIIRSLLHRVQATTSPQLILFLKDAERFILSYRQIIEVAPLQIYGAALTFCPQKSKIRIRYWEDRLPCINNITGIRDSWDPCLQILEGHTDSVKAVAFSPDGQTLASASRDGMILWDMATGAVKQTIECHSVLVGTVTFSLDGRMLALASISASGNGIVQLWDIATGTVKQTFEGHADSVEAVTFSLNSQTLALTSHNQTIQLWNIARAVKQTLKGHTDSIRAVTFSPDGWTLASASDDTTVRLWDTATGAIKQTLNHTFEVRVVAFSPNGQTLASVSFDGTVRLWDTATGAIKQTLNHTFEVQVVAFSPNGQTLASVSFDGTVRLWDTAMGAVKQTLKSYTGWVEAVAFSPNGQMLASVSFDGTVRLWDTALGAIKQTLEGHTAPVNAVVFSPNGQMLASVSDDGMVQLWDTATRAIKQTLDNTFKVQAVTFSPDGQKLALVSYDGVYCRVGTVQLWDVVTGAIKQILKDHTGLVQAVTFSPDGQTLALVSYDNVYGDDGTVQLWDVVTGAVKQTLKGHTGSFGVFTFSPDGQTLALAPYDNVYGDDGTVQLWDMVTGAVKQTLKGHAGSVRAVVFSPDGQTLASASYDQTVKLWDIITGTIKHIFKGHTDLINAVAFSPDGQMLASASYNGTIQLWDTATGAVKQTLKSHRGAVREVSFSIDGKYLKTNKEMLPLNSQSSHMSNYQEQPPYGIFVNQEWVTLRGQNILWLPPDYRARSSAAYNNKLVLGHFSGWVTFLEFSL